MTVGGASVADLVLWTVLLTLGSGATLAVAARLTLGHAPLDGVALAAPAPAIVLLLGRALGLPASLGPVLAIAADFAVVTVAFPLDRRPATVVVLLHALLGGLLLVLLGSVVSVP